MAIHPIPPQTERRDFLKKAGAMAGGAIALLVPLLSGLALLFDPVRRKSANSDAVFVTVLNAVPENGEPRKFPVLATRVDAWNRTPNVPVGAVYLRRTGAKEVQAFNAVCPHAGCFVDYAPVDQNYHCPCHDSSFTLDGRILDRKSPSPRALDELAVEIRPGGEIWVQFQNFRAGVKHRIPA